MQRIAISVYAMLFPIMFRGLHMHQPKKKNMNESYRMINDCANARAVRFVSEKNRALAHRLAYHDYDDDYCVQNYAGCMRWSMPKMELACAEWYR